MTAASDQLREQLKTTPGEYIYDGIPIVELGDAAEVVITPGHVDTVAFAKAYDAYLDEVCGEGRFEWFTVEEFAAEAEYRKARIHHVEVSLGEFEVVFDEAGDVDITVRWNG
jgi:hypothetical protein